MQNINRKSIFISYNLLLVLLTWNLIQVSCKSSFRKQNDLVSTCNDTNTIIRSNTSIRAIPNAVFGKFTYNGTTIPALPYRLYEPSLEKNIGTKIPLILVLHGSGSIGTDNESQLGLLAKLWVSNENKFNNQAFVLAPQFRSRSSNYFLDTNKSVLVSKPESIVNDCLALVDSLKTSLPIDEKRIYVIGYSMGGSTTMNAISLRPDLFAAAISIAGIPQFDSASSIQQIPILLIHGKNDSGNRIQSDSLFYQEMKSNKHVSFLEIKQATHSSIFNYVDMNKIIPTWLFQFRKH